MRTRMLRPQDFVGCRYRLHQRESYPDLPPTHESELRAERQAELRAEIIDSLPPAFDAKKDPFLTLEAMASGEPLIINALFELDPLSPQDCRELHLDSQEFSGCGYSCELDILIPHKQGWMPIIITPHRAVRKDARRSIRARNVARLGYGDSFIEHYKIKSRSTESFRIAAAAFFLERYGLHSGVAGIIGQGGDLCFEVSTERYILPEETHIPSSPRRVRECEGCRYWSRCEKELYATDDLSLFLKGAKGDSFREKGIYTVQDLIDANLTPYSQLAQAWRDHIPAVRRKAPIDIVRREVEIFIDMEAYLEQGCYLWGCWDGISYIPFMLSQPDNYEPGGPGPQDYLHQGLGDIPEARNFARFWSWLMSAKAEALGSGRSFAVYCYSAHGENHWLRESARRFQGFPGIPSPQEIEDFIGSDMWVDVFIEVKKNLIPVEGLGLKVIAPLAGFAWMEEDMDGEKSLEAYSLGEEEKLLSYNRDDCRATAAVRQWLREGAPGIPIVEGDFSL